MFICIFIFSMSVFDYFLYNINILIIQRILLLHWFIQSKQVCYTANFYYLYNLFIYGCLWLNCPEYITCKLYVILSKCKRSREVTMIGITFCIGLREVTMIGITFCVGVREVTMIGITFCIGLSCVPWH
jgi:hypothetical protein